LRPGRGADRKKALADAIAAILKTELNVDARDIYVLFRETPAENHYTGGVPLPPWVPASELAR
jgi:phenylpyruvate tautomerase PptA (4-oxalocrotonate tautomerase family)